MTMDDAAEPTIATARTVEWGATWQCRVTLTSNPSVEFTFFTYFPDEARLDAAKLPGLTEAEATQLIQDLRR